MVPVGASGGEIYRLCGPNATGFISAGRDVACINGSLDWRKQQAHMPAASTGPALRPTPAVTAGTNRKVDEALNDADLAFNKGWTDNGCGWVQNAISADLNDFGGVPSSKEQREQLRQYAQRCNLRY